jgi:hypothetical protein
LLRWHLHTADCAATARRHARAQSAVLSDTWVAALGEDVAARQRAQQRQAERAARTASGAVRCLCSLSYTLSRPALSSHALPGLPQPLRIASLTSWLTRGVVGTCRSWDGEKPAGDRVAGPTNRSGYGGGVRRQPGARCEAAPCARRPSAGADGHPRGASRPDAGIPTRRARACPSPCRDACCAC